MSLSCTTRYGSAPTGSDEDYYLNLTKNGALLNKTDVLAIKLLNSNLSGIVTWESVASAVPPIRKAGKRTYPYNRAYIYIHTPFSDLLFELTL